MNEDDMGGTYSTHGAMRYWNKVLVGKPEGKRPLGKFMSEWKGNNEMCATKVKCEVVDWIKLA
jgi:hypothetical protein